MTKSNKILLGAFSLIVALMMGYALFSESVTVSGTSTAKGHFLITSTCDVINNDSTYVGYVNVSGFKSSGTGSCKIENGVVKTTSTLSKPTEKVNFLVKIHNEDSNNFNINLKKVTSSNNMTPTGASGDILYIDMNTGLSAWYRVYKLDSTQTYCGHTTSSIRGDSNVSSAGILVKNDCVLYMIITHSWEDAAQLGLAQPAVPANGATINYNVELQFEQAPMN